MPITEIIIKSEKKCSKCTELIKKGTKATRRISKGKSNYKHLKCEKRY